MSLLIEKAGSLSLLQDLGRFGYQAIGVTTGGPMDIKAFQWANKLLDNPINAAQIEITMGPFVARFLKPTSFSLCGADTNPKLNGQPFSPWRSMRANAGDILELSFPKQGLRSYLAVSGGFIAEPTLASCSCVVRDKLGGIDGNGNKLCDGDRLDYNPELQPFCRTIPPEYLPDFPEVIELGLLPSYQFNQFSQQAVERFFDAEFKVSLQMDRMGIRLTGESIPSPSQSFLSEGIALGAVQIPADGWPIILMQDRQTIGGYPKIGCICQQDLSQLAQARPGTRISFYRQNIEKASAQLQQQQKFFAESN